MIRDDLTERVVMLERQVAALERIVRARSYQPALPLDVLDVDTYDPPQSEDERYWDEKTDRRLGREL